MGSKVQFVVYVSVLLTTGCGISSFKAQNWNPNDLYRSKNMSICRQQARLAAEPKSETIDSQSNEANIAGNGLNINKTLLKACMEEKGYKLRELTDTENFINILTSPIVLPMSLIGENFDDIY